MEIVNKNGTTKPLEMVVKVKDDKCSVVNLNGEDLKKEIPIGWDDFYAKSTKAREIDWEKVGWTCPRLTKAIRTVVKRVLVQLPYLADIVPPERMGGENGEKTKEQKCCHDFYIAIRHILKEQEWCGKPFDCNQLEGVLRMCHNPTVRDPLRYLMTCLSKAELDRTLETLKNHTLPFDKRLYNVARRLKVSAQWQLDMWNDIIRGRYNLNDIMIACEIAEGKENPPAYFTAIFRNGKPKWLVENETH